MAQEYQDGKEGVGYKQIWDGGRIEMQVLPKIRTKKLGWEQEFTAPKRLGWGITSQKAAQKLLGREEGKKCNRRFEGVSTAPIESGRAGEKYRSSGYPMKISECN